VPTLLLIRHAQGSFGDDDYDMLSPTGHRQVEALAATLRERGVTAHRVISGSLRRQRETALPWRDDGVEIDERWDEYDSDDILMAYSESPVRLEGTGATQREFQDVLERAMLMWIAKGDGGAAAEPFGAFKGRVQAALAELASGLGRGQTALVFTSGGVIAACCLLALGLPDAYLPAFNRVPVNTGITKLIHGRRGTSLVSFNDHGHLEGTELITYR
jgi:broad specificity phosphatase PhoE